MVEIYPNENYKPTESTISANHQWDKHEENHIREHYNEIDKKKKKAKWRIKA